MYITQHPELANIALIQNQAKNFPEGQRREGYTVAQCSFNPKMNIIFLFRRGTAPKGTMLPVYLRSNCFSTGGGGSTSPKVQCCPM